MKPSHQKRTTTIESFSVTIFGKELRELISQELATQGLARLPPNAELYVQVPGGIADWSNEPLNLEDHPIKVRWTVESGDDI